MIPDEVLTAIWSEGISTVFKPLLSQTVKFIEGCDPVGHEGFCASIGARLAVWSKMISSEDRETDEVIHVELAKTCKCHIC